MFKKIIGFILIILATLFSLGSIKSLYETITVPIKKTGNEAYDSGQMMGAWIFLAILYVLIFFMFKFGLKFIKNKKIGVESINDIGTE